VIGEVIDLNPEVAVNIVANAIKHANTGEVLTIRVNPRDVELLREYWAEALGDNPGNHRWEILADRRVKPGGCVIDTQAGSVDAQIDTQLVQIKYAFDRRNADESGG
jgi:flagellar biosynthesis/type III secretory pathway protein FliH